MGESRLRRTYHPLGDQKQVYYYPIFRQIRMSEQEMARAIEEIVRSSPPSLRMRRGAEKFLRLLERRGYAVHDRARQSLDRYFGATLSRDLRDGSSRAFWILLTCGVDSRPAGLFGQARPVTPRAFVRGE